jgi:hypothetical protein
MKAVGPDLFVSGQELVVLLKLILICCRQSIVDVGQGCRALGVREHSKHSRRRAVGVDKRRRKRIEQGGKEYLVGELDARALGTVSTSRCTDIRVKDRSMI